jgi:hypothetical protein
MWLGAVASKYIFNKFGKMVELSSNLTGFSMIKSSFIASKK